MRKTLQPVYTSRPYASFYQLNVHLSLERTEIDKAAATRFIKHAIAQAQWQKTSAEEVQDANDDDSDGQSKRAPAHPRVPARITQKMRDREAYEREMKERDARENSEDELEVFNGNNNDDVDDTRMDVDIDHNSKGKGKEVASTTEGLPSSNNKRQRLPIDPFAGQPVMLPQTTRVLIIATGYGDDIDAASTSSGFKEVRSSSPSPSLPSIWKGQQESSSQTPISQSNTPFENAKASKKKKRAKAAI